MEFLQNLVFFSKDLIYNNEAYDFLNRVIAVKEFDVVTLTPEFLTTILNAQDRHNFWYSEDFFKFLKNTLHVNAKVYEKEILYILFTNKLSNRLKYNVTLFIMRVFGLKFSETEPMDDLGNTAFQLLKDNNASTVFLLELARFL